MYKRRLTLGSTDAVMQALLLGVKAIVIAQTATVDESVTLALGMVERPLVHIIFAGPVFGLDEASIRQIASRRRRDWSRRCVLLLLSDE